MTPTVAIQDRQDAHASSAPDTLQAIQDKIKSCIQCGTCTASCPNAFAMDLTPRHLWRLVLMDETDTIFRSHTFMLCSACYTCSLRCPRGLPLTDAMSDLKQIAAREAMTEHKESTAFYQCFMNSVRRHGRVHEMGFISAYFRSLMFRSPLLPLRYTPMGMRLMGKGKLGHHGLLGTGSRRSLEPLFRKAETMEERQ
ncbi:MAG: 4Fe-4S dicluster domain-containing protein [Desulfobacterales bacterium]|jgi:heterodisulfide reductase subunit C